MMSKELSPICSAAPVDSIKHKGYRDSETGKDAAPSNIYLAKTETHFQSTAQYVLSLIFICLKFPSAFAAKAISAGAVFRPGHLGYKLQTHRITAM